MEINEVLSELRNRLPHGAIKTISDRSGINYYTVLRVMNGDTASNQTADVINAATEYYIEYQQKLDVATKTLTDVLALIDKVLETEPIREVVLNWKEKQKSIPEA